MTWGILQIVVFLVLLGLIAKPLGTYMAHVYSGERTFLHPVLRPVERFIYRVCGVDEKREMGVAGYVARAPRLQLHRPPLHLRGPAPAGPPAAQPGARAGHEPLGGLQHGRELRDQHELAGLRPRDAVSYLTQMLALARENFVSAAVGMAAAVAFIRGLTRQSLERARQLLGRLHPQLPLHPAADLDRRRAASSSRRASSRT